MYLRRFGSSVLSICDCSVVLYNCDASQEIRDCFFTSQATLRKVRRAARVVVPQSVKERLAEHLGVCPPRRPGQTIPDVRPRMSTAIDFQRNRAGIPILDLFGQRDRLDYFSSG